MRRDKDGQTYYIVRVSLPPPACSPNWRGGHWAVRAKAKKIHRAEAMAAARLEMRGDTPPRWIAAHFEATFHLPDKRKRDPGNLQASLKAAIDGIVDSGMLADDDQLTIHPTKKQVSAHSRVEMRVWAMEVTNGQ